jgi:hypothetical protein
LTTVNDILYCTKEPKNSYESECAFRQFVPKKLRRTVLTAIHNDMNGAHLGERKTWLKVSDRFYWPGMRKDTTDWVESCPNCAARKAPPTKQDNITHDYARKTSLRNDRNRFPGPTTTHRIRK